MSEGVGGDDENGADDEYDDEAMFDVLCDAAAEGTEIAVADAKDDLERWAKSVVSELRLLEAEADRLPEEARAAIARARALVDAVDPDEEPEWEEHDGHSDEWYPRIVFWESEAAYEAAQVELARARVARDAAPPPPTWDDLRSGEARLFAVEGEDAIPRPSSTERKKLKAGVRTRVSMRARRRCEICGVGQSDGEPPLEFGHVLSLEDGLRLGFAAQLLNSEENIVMECFDCNRGHGRETLPLWLVAGIFKARTENRAP